MIGRLFRWTLWLVFLFVLSSLIWVIATRWIDPRLTFTMMSDANGATRIWRDIETVDRDMIRAAIAGEDGKFCSHRGFDREAIEAAFRRNARGAGVLRGGSTISQQAAKNVFLWQGGGYFRKGLESWFTLLIEQAWGKKRIMEVYLNVAETGIGTYGVEAGARRYFGHGANHLTPSEAARIAAVLPLPKRRAAIVPRGFTRSYGARILAGMPAVRRERLDGCV